MGCATLVERKKDKQLFVVKEINVKGLSERDKAEAMQEVCEFVRVTKSGTIASFRAATRR